jgi:hypothetical protein
MNCIPATGNHRAPSLSVRLPLLLSLAALCACGVPASEAETTDEEQVYRLEYRARPDRDARGMHVEMRLRQPVRYLRELDMPDRAGRITDVSGDGEVAMEDGRIVWKPPADGGSLRWFAQLEHRRGEDSYDAWVADDWALFRGEDIAPPAATRTLRGARSATRLVFELPDGWSSVTPYFGRDDSYDVENPERRFVTPTGWIVLGELGIRNETIADVRTKVAGPTGHGIRRMDMLALLSWTLPEIQRLFPDFPGRLTIVSAGEPMWRGALSAPQSIYIHADRPLISENGTSTLLHETMHVGLGLSAEHGADWIVEGLAEYYSLEILRRSGTITTSRYRRAREDLEDWGREARNLCTRHSTGSTTARAVTVIAALAGELQRKGNGSNLDDVVSELSNLGEKITLERFRDLITDRIGEAPDALDGRKLPGCT